MTAIHHLPFTRGFLEACTDLKLMELRDVLLRERPEDQDLQAVWEELAKRQKKAQERRMNAQTDHQRSETVRPGTNPPAERHPPAYPEDPEHEGATEDEITPTTPPSGPEYDDEPKQG